MRLRSIEEYLYVHATETPEKVAVVVGNPHFCLNPIN